MRRYLFALALAAAPASLAAQSSQFGIRGLGFPGRAISTRSAATGGSFGLFDPEASQNAAAIGALAGITAGFTLLQDFRSAENPAGSATQRQARFPQVIVAGPARGTRLSFGISFTNYTSRDFELGSSSTIQLRGQPVDVVDSLSSRGGLNDLQLLAAYRPGVGWSVGAGLHILTGSERIVAIRNFADDAFLDVRQRSEVSATGLGVSVGVLRQVGSSLVIAATARTDGTARIDRDSLRVAEVDLPYSFGLGVRGRPNPRLDLAAEARYFTWSGANSDLQAQGTAGSGNTVELSFGGEYLTDPRRSSHLPLRAGVHYRTLPFFVLPDEQPTELGVSLGTGTRFAADRGGIDIAVERNWRSGGEAYSESAWTVWFGVSVRP